MDANRQVRMTSNTFNGNTASTLADSVYIRLGGGTMNFDMRSNGWQTSDPGGQLEVRGRLGLVQLCPAAAPEEDKGRAAQGGALALNLAPPRKRTQRAKRTRSPARCPRHTNTPPPRCDALRCASRRPRPSSEATST